MSDVIEIDVKLAEYYTSIMELVAEHFCELPESMIEKMHLLDNEVGELTNFSEAPEGATHHHPHNGTGPEWYRYGPKINQWSFYLNDKERWFTSCLPQAFFDGLIPIKGVDHE